MAVFQVFNLTDKQMANVGIIIAFLPTLLEVFSALLANEEYDTNEPKATEWLLGDNANRYSTCHDAINDVMQ